MKISKRFPASKRSVDGGSMSLKVGKYTDEERNIAPTVGRIPYVSKPSEKRTGRRFDNLSFMPHVSHASKTDCHPGWGEE